MIKFYFQASRVKNVIIAIFCCLIAIFKVSSNDYIAIFFSSIIVIFLMVASNFVNDIFDMKVDRINKPNRPLIKHPKLKKNFQWIAFALFFISLIISFCINNMAALIVVFSIPVLLAYTPFLKGVPLIGNIVVSFYLSLVFIFVEVCLSGSLEIMFLPASFAFGISLIREIIKDAEDYKGDKIKNIYTLPVCVGIKKTIYLSCFLMVCFLFFSGALMFYLNNFYYNISVFFLVFIPIFYLIFFLIKSPTSKSCSEASALLKKITILGLIIIYII